MLLRRFEIAPFALLCCTLACDPPPQNDDDGGNADETESGTTLGDPDTDTTDTDTDGGTDASEECPPEPEIIPCESDAPCAEGLKCSEFEGIDCWGVPMEDAACLPVIGDRKAGESCTIIEEVATPTFTWRFDDCDADTRCLPFDTSSLEGICVPYCDVEENCADPSLTCGTRVLSLCLERCDPTASTCEGGFVCDRAYAPHHEFHCSSARFEPGKGQLGDQCKTEYECENGLGCVDGQLLPDCPDDKDCCSPWCSVYDVDSCSGLGPDFTCLAYYQPDQAPATLAHVGQCVAF